ncbi:MAG: AAA family ATPase [Oscillospiraceae bacterium]|nr:AAA family ATPase [Oscillospiraceae bacterium]
MIIIISGATHTGKTVLADRLLKEYHYPVLSQDLLKMGLIRSGNTALTPEDDREMTDYLWKIVREMIKTAVENKQNLIVEGCYVPFDWKKDFEEEYLKEIRCVFLVFSEEYIRNNYAEIIKHANDIEQRLDDSHISEEYLISENRFYLDGCKKSGTGYILIDKEYIIEAELNKKGQTK